MDGESHPTIRGVLSPIIGRTIVDITATDWDEVQRGESDEITIMFDDGNVLVVPTTEGIYFTEKRKG